MTSDHVLVPPVLNVRHAGNCRNVSYMVARMIAHSQSAWFSASRKASLTLRRSSSSATRSSASTAQQYSVLNACEASAPMNREQLDATSVGANNSAFRSLVKTHPSLHRSPPSAAKRRARLRRAQSPARPAMRRAVRFHRAAAPPQPRRRPALLSRVRASRRITPAPRSIRRGTGSTGLIARVDCPIQG